MADFIAIGIILILVFAACFYIYKQKKKGVNCIGCPSAGICGKKASCCPPSDDKK